MRRILLIIAFLPINAFAGFTVCHDGLGNIVNQSDPSAICVYYSDTTTGMTVYSRVKNVLQTVPRQYLKWVTEPVEMTQAEKDAVDAAEAADQLTRDREGAKSQLDSTDALGKLIRAEADIIKDEINILRQWLMQFKADVAAANNLAQLQSSVAASPDLPDRDLSQLKTQIKNRIDSGNADF